MFGNYVEYGILFMAPRINTIVALPVGEHNNYDMEYIVHGSKNQYDSGATCGRT